MRNAMQEMVKHFGASEIEVFADMPHAIFGGMVVETVRVAGEWFDVWFRADYSIDHVNPA